MPKFWDIAVKNLKSIYRDKKSWLFILLIPVFYYSLMGFLFGGRMGNDTYVYTIGYVNMDEASTFTNQANFNVSEIYTIIEEAEAFHMRYYTDNDTAILDLEEENVDTVVVFQEGFQEYLNSSSQKKYAIFDNDTSVAHISNYTHQVNHFINVSSSYLDITNVSDFIGFMTNFSDPNFPVDYVIVFQEGFEANLDTTANANYTFYYREGTSETTVDIQNMILTSTIESIMLQGHLPSESSIIESTTMVIGSSVPKFQPEIQFYFRDSTDVTSKQIMKGMVMAFLDGIINYNPSSVDLSYTDIPISGQTVSWLTTGTPGYIMYGMLSLLSMATILITNEKKTGTLKRLESSRMRPFDMLFGHIISNTAVVITQFLIGVGVLTIFGFRPIFASVWSLLFGTLITLLLASVFINALSLVAAVIFKTPEASGGGVWVFLIPLMTFSGAFFPLEVIAPGLVPYTSWIPTRIVVLLFQDIFVDGIGLLDPSIWLNFLWLTLWGAGLFAIGAFLYRRFAQS